MIPALAIPLAVEGSKALLGAVQAGLGANKLKKLERPTYEIPDEIRRNMTEAEMQAYEGLPAEQKQQYLQNIQRGQATAVKGLSDRKAGLTGITDVLQAQNDAFTNLVSMDAAARQQNRMLSQQARQTMASYKDKAFDVNKMQPYQEKSEEAQALISSGIQNIGSAMDNAATAAMFSGQPKAYVDPTSVTTTPAPANNGYANVDPKILDALNIFNRTRKR